MFMSVIRTCSNLDVVHNHMGDLQQAKDYYQRRLAARIKALGPTHVHVWVEYVLLQSVT